MKVKPLDDLELFELLSAAYPEKFTGDDDETWEAVQQFADEISGWQDVADLLGRVVMLTMPMESGITKRLSHCLGSVTIKDGSALMTAAVRRDVDMAEAVRPPDAGYCGCTMPADLARALNILQV